MSPENIYAELYAVALKVGKLDADAVRGASGILALPRYAASLIPQALLAEDLTRVIEAIPDDAPPDVAGDLSSTKESAKPGLKKYARWYFSLDEPGTNLSHRRLLGGDPGGTGRMWMNRGVIYRVATGLLELIAASAAGSPVALPDAPASYSIDTVIVTRSFFRSLYAKTEWFDYDLSLHTTGPHVLVLPKTFRAGLASINATASTERPDAGTDCEVVRGQDGRYIAVVFGTHWRTGDRGRVRITSKDPRPRLRLPRFDVAYSVDIPIRKLTLRVWGPSSTDRHRYKWQAATTSDADIEPSVIDVPDEGTLSIDNPVIGHTYRLQGQRLRKGENPDK